MVRGGKDSSQSFFPRRGNPIGDIGDWRVGRLCKPVGRYAYAVFGGIHGAPRWSIMPSIWLA
jgi:hypothetical protein